VPALAPLQVYAIGEHVMVDLVGSRRVQSSSGADARPNAWIAEFMLAIVPSTTAADAGSQVFAALTSMLPDELATATRDKLPLRAQPDSIATDVSAPHIVSLPIAVAAGLEIGLEAPETTETTTQPKFIATTDPNQQSEVEDLGSSATEPGLDGSTIAILILAAITIPPLCAVMVFVVRRFNSELILPPSEITQANKVDFRFTIEAEELTNDNAADVDPEAVSSYLRDKEIKEKREKLTEAMLKGKEEAGGPQELTQEEEIAIVENMKEMDNPRVDAGPDEGIRRGRASLQDAEGEAGDMMEQKIKAARLARPKKKAKSKFSRRQAAKITCLAFCGCIRERLSIPARALQNCMASFAERHPRLCRCCRRCPCCRRRPVEETITEEADGGQPALEDLPEEEIEDQATSARDMAQSARGSARDMAQSARSSDSPRSPGHPGGRSSRSSAAGMRSSRTSANSTASAGSQASDFRSDAEEEVNEHGLTVQQVKAMQEFWQFQGSEQILQDLKPIKNYHQAMRDEKVDTSLASKYGADGQGGNKVVCNVTEDTDRKTRTRMELKTLQFAPPERKIMAQVGNPEADIKQMIQDGLSTNNAAQEAKEVDEKKEEAEEKSEESDEDDSDASETDQKKSAFDPTSSQASGDGNSDKNKSFTSLLAGGVMGTMMESQAINMEIVDIEPPDPKAVKEAVERAKETETYRDAMEKLKEHLDDEQDPRYNRRKKHEHDEHDHEHHDEQNHLQEREGRAVDMCALFHTK